MKISLNWLRLYVDVTETPEELARLLTMAGLEVASITTIGEGIEDVIIAKILTKDPHPEADRLSLCTVTDGRETHQIVCGATNMIEGDHVALAPVGANLPGGFKIKKAKIRGRESFGMMCSKRELGLGDDHAGLMILAKDTVLGDRLVDVMGYPDSVIEVEITPNRPDWLSVVGVAREIAALTGRELKLPAPAFTEGTEKAAELTSVTIEDPDLCPRYAARLIRGVKIAPSPRWMQARLESAGVRPISNVVDVTNYVLMELGHPLHAFDLNRLSEKRIIVKRAENGAKFTTLDGQERTLTADNLMICDGTGPVALAGVMGGLNSEVEDATTDILLESAYFAPTSIRRTAKVLGLKTEASYRFERGTDIDGLILALDRAAQLIKELAGGIIASGRVDAYPKPAGLKTVPLRLAKAESVLGLAFPADEAKNILTGLGLTVQTEREDMIYFTVPAFRVDLEREIDLIEELARVKGYGFIPSTMPNVSRDRDSRTVESIEDAAKDALAAAGLVETITLSFIDPADDDRIGLKADSSLRRKTVIQNPLGRETSVLRTSLLPGLLSVAELNARRGNRDIRIFETGRTFHPEEESGLPRETHRAGALITGRRAPLAWWAGNERADFFDIKGTLETILARMGIRGVAFNAADEIEWLKPGRAATVKAGETPVGWIGEIHPDILDRFELTAPVAAFEINLEVLEKAETGPFPGLIKFPAVERDLAIIVDRTVHLSDILGAVNELGIGLLKGIALFDAFEGGKIPEGKQSLALRFTYLAPDRTLTEEEVAEQEKTIVDHFSKKLGARLRDA